MCLCPRLCHLLTGVTAVILVKASVPHPMKVADCLSLTSFSFLFPLLAPYSSPSSAVFKSNHSFRHRLRDLCISRVWEELRGPEQDQETPSPPPLFGFFFSLPSSLPLGPWGAGDTALGAITSWLQRPPLPSHMHTLPSGPSSLSAPQPELVPYSLEEEAGGGRQSWCLRSASSVDSSLFLLFPGSRGQVLAEARSQLRRGLLEIWGRGSGLLGVGSGELGGGGRWPSSSICACGSQPDWGVRRCLQLS